MHGGGRDGRGGLRGGDFGDGDEGGRGLGGGHGTEERLGATREWREVRNSRWNGVGKRTGAESGEGGGVRKAS